MNKFNSNPKENENIDSREEFLTDIKTWLKRLRVDRPIIMIIILILIFLIIFGLAFFIGDLEYYIGPIAFTEDILAITAAIYSLWVGFKVPRKFQNLLIANKDFFVSEDIFKKYKRFVRDTFRSKKEFYIPLIIAILVSINWINNSFLWFMYIFPIYEINFGFLLIVFMLAIFIRAIIYIIIYTIAIILAVSGIIIITFAFKCLNCLGTEEFPLNVTYKELRMGGFHDLGKFIMSMTIPGILLSTLISALGLVWILVFKIYATGYIIIFVAIVIDLIFIIVLFRSTINLHKIIIKFKSKLKRFLLDEVGKYSRPISGEIDYQKISNIYDYYDKIDKTSNWPFDTTMIKKLIITFSSTVVPLILSLLGFG